MSCDITGNARRCIKVDGVFYTCGETEPMKRALDSAGETFHHKRETDADMVMDPRLLNSLSMLPSTLSLMFRVCECAGSLQR